MIAPRLARRRPRLASACLVAASAALLASGCGLELRDRLKGIKRTIDDARENGAYKCAPRELAMAETHYEFTVDELDYGNYVGAKDEIEVAAKNARAAYDLSPKEKCAPNVAIVEKKKPVIVVTPTDTDGDGTLDKDDKCVEVPGPKENAGCPFTDTDKDGTLDKDDKCVEVPGPKENAGCPWPDRDKDTVLDKDDKCPDDPGPVELGGCPDRDKDTVLDKDDKCPDEPGSPANNGCPYKLIVVTKDKIELKQKVFFDTDKATIKPQSFEMLNEIADVLSKNRTLEVRIEGHTDSRASLKHNMKLSQGRAASVRGYLVGRGVDPTRMTAIGYGPTRPIDDNRTAIGREANRRVEFFITKQ